MAKLIAKTYADALFETALEENRLDEIAQDVEAVSTAFMENEELTKLICHPKIASEEKQEVMASILKGRVADELTSFVHIVIDKGRYLELQGIFEYFMECVKEYKNIGTAYVTTAVELTRTQKTQVVNRLLETTRYEKIEVHYEVDSALIGGMVIRIGDRVVDSSVRTKLNGLTKQLLQIQLG